MFFYSQKSILKDTRHKTNINQNKKKKLLEWGIALEHLAQPYNDQKYFPAFQKALLTLFRSALVHKLLKHLGGWVLGVQITLGCLCQTLRLSSQMLLLFLKCFYL